MIFFKNHIGKLLNDQLKVILLKFFDRIFSIAQQKHLNRYSRSLYHIRRENFSYSY